MRLKFRLAGRAGPIESRVGAATGNRRATANIHHPGDIALSLSLANSTSGLYARGPGPSRHPRRGMSQVRPPRGTQMRST